MKISYLINIGLLLVFGSAFLFDSAGLLHKTLLSTGLFGLSGSLTNALAVHMLFERIPFIYGSGIIALNFQEIKKDLEELLLAQFFSKGQIDRFLSEELETVEFDLGLLDELLDYEKLFDRFKQSLGSQGNPMMSMALPLLEMNRTSIIESMRLAVNEELHNEDLQTQVRHALSAQLQNTHADSHSQFEGRVRSLISGRLQEMTPQMVKEIIQHMLESKLIWLIIWGALIGAIMGLAAALLRYFLLF